MERSQFRFAPLQPTKFYFKGHFDHFLRVNKLKYNHNAAIYKLHQGKERLSAVPSNVTWPAVCGVRHSESLWHVLLPGSGPNWLFTAVPNRYAIWMGADEEEFMTIRTSEVSGMSYSRITFPLITGSSSGRRHSTKQPECHTLWPVSLPIAII